MALLDYLSRSTSQPVLAEGSTAAPAPVAEASLLAPVIAVEEPKETTSVIAGEPEAVAAPEVLAAPASEPLKAEPVVEKQPTTTHAESGTAHVDSEAATKVDGTTDKTAAVEPEVKETETAAPVAEGSKAVVEEPKEKKDEAKKVAVKDKVEKTKVEGKGFFAKFFGSKEKSPKKQKVKTPKVEKTDPIASEPTTTTETAATEATPVETAPVAESSTSAVPEVTGAAITTDSAVDAPAHAEAPAVPTMDTKPEVIAAKEAEAAATPAAAVETPAESTAVPVAGETKDSAAKEETPNPRNIKATRRLSSRITSFVHKIGGKKDGTTTPPKEDKEELKETTESHLVSSEAPKLDEPAPAEPLKMEETKSTPPPAATVVSSTA